MSTSNAKSSSSSSSSGISPNAASASTAQTSSSSFRDMKPQQQLKIPHNHESASAAAAAATTSTTLSNNLSDIGNASRIPTASTPKVQTTNQNQNASSSSSTNTNANSRQQPLSAYSTTTTPPASASSISSTSSVGKAYKLNLSVHTETFSQHELVLFINPRNFPDLAVGEIVELFQPDRPPPVKNRRLLLQIAAIEQTLQSSNPSSSSSSSNPSLSMTGNSTAQSSSTSTSGAKQIVSVRNTVADLFDLQAHTDIMIRHVAFSSAALDFIELSFKDQFISRSDMWRFTLNLVNKSAYVSKAFSWSGFNVSLKKKKAIIFNSFFFPLLISHSSDRPK